MKLRNLMWGACACILAAGCSNDDVAVDNGQSNIVQEDGNAYVKVRIAMAGGPSSRADEGTGENEYEYGTEIEQAIDDVFFVFYKDDGSWSVNGELQTSVTIPEDGHETYEGNGQNPVEAIAEAVIALKLNENQPFPTQVIAFVNMKDAQVTDNGTLKSLQTALVNKNITDAKKLIATGIQNSSNHFYMTSSTYYNNGEQIAAQVERDNFFDTEEAAKEANPVDIYVERLAAKVSVSESATPADITNVGDYTLSFKSEGWAISGTNTKEYCLKNIQTSWNSWKWHWNEAADHRCFWAEDPNYSSTSNGDLTYLNYNSISGTPATPFYIMENTMNGVGGDYETTTHLLLVGSYTLKNAQGEVVKLEEAEGSDGNLYMFGGTAYLATDLIKRLLTGAQNAGNSYALAYVQTSQDSESYEQADASAYELVSTSDNDLTTVTLRLKSNTGTTYYTTTNGETFTAITEGEQGNYSSFNENLETVIGGLGTIDGYNGGKAYFAMPIEHFGGEDEEGGDATGTHGIVRNHSYHLTITTITGLGEGVFQPEKPIIPSDEQKTYYMAARLNVLSWKTVGNQNVEF